MDLMNLVSNFVFAFFCTLGFGVLFNIPRSNLFKASIIGAFGWIAYTIIVESGNSPIFGSLIGAVTVGILGEISANLFKTPATVYIIPGIIPFVPGYGVYYTMISLVEKNYTAAVSKGSETLFIALSIACGLIISSTLGKLYRRNKVIKIAKMIK